MKDNTINIKNMVYNRCIVILICKNRSKKIPLTAEEVEALR